MPSSPAPSAPSVQVREVDFGVRPTRLRLPFKFGAITLTQCPQVFVRATVDCGALGIHEGWAAEMMVPRWFDKRPHRSQVENVADLERALHAAAGAYADTAPATAFALFAEHYAELMNEGERHGATGLSTSFGQAVLDRAVLDALCRALQVSVYEAFQRNLVGFGDAQVMRGLDGWDWNAWLARLAPQTSLHARHTVGMLDALADAERHPVEPAALPTGLPAIVQRYGHRFFKIKLGGDPEADLRRLDAVLAVLDTVQPGHRFTLDGNEQYADLDALQAFAAGLSLLPRFAARPHALLYLEQPLPREASLDPGLATLRLPTQLLLDEADGTLDAFPQARVHGWHGVSSKGCKGLYKAIINRARCDSWNATLRSDGRPPCYFMSAEDLTCQAGLAVQQDLALAALLGLGHCERNGHHYVDGFGEAPAHEQQRFAAVHGDLYEASSGHPRLAIREGRIAIGSLARTHGFAHGADPVLDSLQPLKDAVSMVRAPSPP